MGKQDVVPDVPAANPSASVPAGSEDSKVQFYVGDLSLDSFRLYLGAWNAPHFSQGDMDKSLRDEQTERYQPKSVSFVPHRTDENGNIIFPTEEEIANCEHFARSEALRLRLELEPDTTRKSFFVDGSTERLIYCKRPAEALTKNQKAKLRKKRAQDAQTPLEPSARASSPSEKPRPRRYIVDSGASFHLVDPRSLTPAEQKSIEPADVPIDLETANGTIRVDTRARVYVKELELYVWAFLKEDTISVLSLGLLVNRSGYTYLWKPGQLPQLSIGKKVYYCTPSSNVPFIYTAGYLEYKRGRKRLARIKAVYTPLPSVAPAKSSETFEEILEDEMKGLEDLIPEASSEETPSDSVPAVPSEQDMGDGSDWLPARRPRRRGRSRG